jgi:hypothetical protein
MQFQLPVHSATPFRRSMSANMHPANPLSSLLQLRSFRPHKGKQPWRHIPSNFLSLHAQHQDEVSTCIVISLLQYPCALLHCIYSLLLCAAEHTLFHIFSRPWAERYFAGGFCSETGRTPFWYPFFFLYLRYAGMPSDDGMAMMRTNGAKKLGFFLCPCGLAIASMNFGIELIK